MICHRYLQQLYDYLTGFIRRAAPLEDLDALLDKYAADLSASMKEDQQPELFCLACE